MSKILSIVKNDRITGIEYGMIEIGGPVSSIHSKKYQQIQNSKNIKLKNHRTRQK